MSSKADDDNEDDSTASPISPPEERCDQLTHDLMTSSYNEISFSESDDQTDVELAEELDHSFDENNGEGVSNREQLSKKLSTSLSLPHLSSTIVKWTEQTKASYETENLNLSSNKCFDPNQKTDEIPDYVSYEGNIVSYVAQDFQQKLKHSTSSPSIEDQNSEHSSQHSKRIDIKLLNELEKQSKLLSQNINQMLRHISESTHNITSLTVECIATYETTLNKTCDVIDANIKQMYQLMAKCEELNQSMKPINNLSEQLREVKRLLELFEKAVDYKM